MKGYNNCFDRAIFRSKIVTAAAFVFLLACIAGIILGILIKPEGGFPSITLPLLIPSGMAAVPCLFVIGVSFMTRYQYRYSYEYAKLLFDEEELGEISRPSFVGIAVQRKIQRLQQKCAAAGDMTEYERFMQLVSSSRMANITVNRV